MTYVFNDGNTNRHLISAIPSVPSEVVLSYKVQGSC